MSAVEAVAVVAALGVAADPRSQNVPGDHVRQISRRGLTEWLITVNRRTGEGVENMLCRFAEIVRACGATVTTQQVFGLPGHSRACLNELFRGEPWPITWLDEASDIPGAPAGTWARAISGADVSRIRWAGRVVGSAYEDEGASYCELGDLRCDDSSQAPEIQATTVLQSMPETLAQAGMTFGHVLRTWFFNHHITRWYPEFNRARTSFFNQQRVWDGLLPASTGVGGSNPVGTALVAGLLAMKSKASAAKAQVIYSPLQCPAPQYGSSFSRAVEMSMPGYRWLTISGTASIDPAGHTAHVDDTAKQIELTLQVVDAILKSRNFTFADISRSVAYFKDAADVPLLRECLQRLGIAAFPAIPCRMDICRDDLLFELEADATGSTP